MPTPIPALLVPFAQVASPPPAPSAAKPPGSVYVSFDLEDHTQAWVLKTKEGAVVCQLPCARWVPPGSGLTVDRVDYQHISYRAYVPDGLGWAEGTRVKATVLPKRGHELGPALMLYAGGSTAFIVVVIGSVCMAIPEQCHISRVASGAMILGASVYITAAAWWYAWTRNSTKLEWEAERAAKTGKTFLALGPGTITGSTGGVGFVVGPGFLSGAF